MNTLNRFLILNGVMVTVEGKDEEMLKNSYVIRQIIKGSNRYKTKDFGIKVSENSSLQDIKSSCITNRRVQRTEVGLYEFKFNGGKYLITVCDNPNQSESSYLANIIDYEKIWFWKVNFEKGSISFFSFYLQQQWND